MANLPDSMKFTAAEQAELDQIKAAAKIRHEKARKAAKKAGRKDFPLLPYECSWAFEEEFRRSKGVKISLDPMPVIFANQERLRVFKALWPAWNTYSEDQLAVEWNRFLVWYAERN